MVGKGQHRHLGKVVRLHIQEMRKIYRKKKIENYKLLLSLLIRDYLIMERPNECLRG